MKKARLTDCNLLARIDQNSADPLNKKIRMDKKVLVKLFEDKIKKDFEFFLDEKKGFVEINKEFSGYKNSEIYWLAVDKKYQKQGIGKKLVSFAESYCKDQAKKGIYLYTHPLHKAAIKLYKKLGYQKVNVFPNYYSNGDASILYGKLLK